MIISNVCTKPKALTGDVILTPRTRKGTKLQKEFNAPLRPIIIERNGGDIDAIVRLLLWKSYF